MKISSSLSQLWRESRANPGFTALYIGGVAFAVAFTMLYAIIFYINLAPLYPEYNRSDTGYISYIQIKDDSTNYMSSGTIGQPFIDRFLKDSKNIEYYCQLRTAPFEGFQITSTDNKIEIFATTKMVDQNFFKLYDYEFLAGRPFNEVEIEATMPNFAIITGEIADRLFGSPEEAIGKGIKINFEDFRVVGVIRRGNPIAYNSYADLIVPYAYDLSPKELRGNMRDYLGPFTAIVKFKDEAQRERFSRELAENIHKANNSSPDNNKIDDKAVRMIQSHSERVLTGQGEGTEDIGSKIRTLLLMLLVLLIVPAINISGMIGGQMDRRMAEIGVRRSFGATRSQLTGQVMFENFVLTLTGGIIGFFIAWVTLIVCRKWLLMLLVSSWQTADAPVDVSAEMLFSPVIFVGALLICLLLNLLSAYIPVRLSLRKPIVTSLNSKR